MMIRLGDAAPPSASMVDIGLWGILGGLLALVFWPMSRGPVKSPRKKKHFGRVPREQRKA